MSLSRDREPNVRITYHGINHHPANIQGEEHIKSALNTHLSLSEGKNVLWIENHDYTVNRAREFDYDVNRQDYIQFLATKMLERELNYVPSAKVQERARRYAEITTQEGLEAALVDKLIPPDAFWELSLAQAVDSLRPGNNLKLRSEFHPTNSHKEIMRFKTLMNQSSRVFVEAWKNGQFDKALEGYRLTRFYLGRVHWYREIDLLGALLKEVRGFIAEGEGSEFILLGANHEPMVTSLQRKLEPKSPAIFDYSIEIPQEYPDLQVDNQLRANQKPSSDLLARGVYATVLGMELHRYFSSTASKTAHYAFHHEDLLHIITEVATELNMEQIRKACETKTPVLEHFSSTPNAQAADKLLPGIV